MYGRMYTASVSVAVTAIQDFFEILAPATAIIVVHRIFLGQSSDAGDAQAEMLRVQIERFNTTGSGGTTLTARPHNVGHAATGATVEANNTTQGSTSIVTLFEEAFNVQAGWFWVPTPEERIIIPPSGFLSVALPAAPGDSLTMQGSITFEEID